MLNLLKMKKKKENKKYEYEIPKKYLSAGNWCVGGD